MPTLAQMIKSKTVDINMAYFAVFIVLKAYNIIVPQEAVAAGSLILNFVLRCLTKGPLSEK